MAHTFFAIVCLVLFSVIISSNTIPSIGVPNTGMDVCDPSEGPWPFRDDQGHKLGYSRCNLWPTVNGKMLKILQENDGSHKNSAFETFGFIFGRIKSV